MRLQRLRSILAATTLFCVSSGCSLTLGPRAETRYVVVHPGRPIEILENKSLKGRVLDGSGDAVSQDVGGWVTMPPDHWEAVKRKLEAK